MDNQNQNARYIDKFGSSHTNVKIHRPPGGASTFSLGWDDNKKNQQTQSSEVVKPFQDNKENNGNFSNVNEVLKIDQKENKIPTTSDIFNQNEKIQAQSNNGGRMKVNRQTDNNIFGNYAEDSTNPMIKGKKVLGGKSTFQLWYDNEDNSNRK